MWSCARKRFYRICIAGFKVQVDNNDALSEFAHWGVSAPAIHIAGFLCIEGSNAFGEPFRSLDAAELYRLLTDPDESTLVDGILDLFESIGMCVRTTYREACLGDDEGVIDGDVEFAKDYVETRTGAPAERMKSYGWYAYRKKHKLGSITRFWFSRVVGCGTT